MGIFKALNKFISSQFAYEVTCKYCGQKGCGSTLSGAIRNLQDYSSGCGMKCHEPIITKRPD